MKTNLQNEYRNLFARLAFPLTKRHGMTETQIARAELVQGFRLPQALRDYYLVAGREPMLNQCFNRLCRPKEWEARAGKLVFMEENQAVVVWGVPVTSRPSQDPFVHQCPRVGDDLGKWYSEGCRCSTFLKFMLHLQAGYGGGMPCTASAQVDSDLAPRLKPDWSFYGGVNGMRAYSRVHQVVCVAKWPDLLAPKKAWRIFAGATTMDELARIATDLGVKLE